MEFYTVTCAWVDLYGTNDIYVDSTVNVFTSYSEAYKYMEKDFHDIEKRNKDNMLDKWLKSREAYFMNKDIHFHWQITTMDISVTVKES